MDDLIGLEVEVLLEGGEITLEIRNEVGVGVVVIYTQSASHINQFEPDALLFIAVLQLIDGLAQHDVGLHLGDLRPDVKMESPEMDVGQLHGMAHDWHERLDADAEFVLGGACGDEFVGVGVNVRIDPDGDGRGLAHLGGELIDDVQFGNGFHVKAPDAFFQSQFDFPIGFSHARESHLMGGETSLDGGLDFVAAH